MVTRLTGEEIEQIKQEAADHFWPHSKMAGDMSEETGLKVVTRAKGVWVEDAEGQQWFDTMAGLWLKNIGHGRKEIADAVYKQMQEISFSPFDTVSPSTAHLAARVAKLAPDKDSRIYFVSGGSEAVETALKMAKNYHMINGEGTRWKILSRWGSYHGATLACTSLGRGGIMGSLPSDFGPLVPGNVHVAQPGEYRCQFCRDKGGCNLECARDVDRTIQNEGPSTVAAFIGEPISAAAGIFVPHPEYWPTIREICDKHGVVMICDEVITGFGRTGKMFATEHWGVQPDIFTVAKALTSGYLPIGAAVASSKIANAFMGEGGSTFQHLFTFGGNPTSCAAGMANLDIMEGEGMVENSAKMGDYLYEQLQSLYEHRIVGDVRGGMGLLAAVEIVKDRDTRERFPAEAGVGQKVSRLMREHNMLGRAADVIPLSPPLCITKEEVDHLVRQLDSMIGKLEQEL
ncbi:MAG: aspartate aminotransferase family protein [Chloroflexi bacterium]|nr:aspartate aminotransferase family protein [Chloroflexota bacterium]MDA1227427.1 aspartate aminotransferase family protein [Chloroflexota bacterium]